ncbi:Clp protease N-terminal domain-containing protein [Jiangella gansuensis]|uniref:Clp protease N-terminal domain-containing protein n=1 Tax=Jiangella gansuensis TaxID=281473 RepID=UPI00047E9F11|nr:Clp protease N-terminal domain-containing protein [Jiangella gansuensis]
MFERFTTQARDTVVQAQQEARELHHRWIGTEHLLLALLRQPDAPGVATLTRLGVTADAARSAVTTVVAADAGGPLDGEDAEALRSLGIDLDEVTRRAEATFGEGALDSPPEADRGRRSGLLRRLLPSSDAAYGHIPFVPRAKKALELSLREAIARKDKEIGTEHLVLALLRGDDKLTLGVFRHLGLEPGVVRDEVASDLRRAA